MRAEVSAQAASMPAFLISGERPMIVNFDKDFRNLKTVVAKMLETEEDPVLREKVLKVQEIAAQLHALAEPGLQMHHEGKSPAEVHSYFEKNAMPLAEEEMQLIDEVALGETRDFQAAKNELERTVNRSFYALLTLAVLAVVFLSVMVGLLMKVMRQKKAYDEAQARLLAQETQMSRARKEAVEVVAHDLKNPIGAIMMSLDLMFDQVEESGDAPLKRALGIAQRSAKSMENLIRDLLDHAKIEAGTLAIERKPNDIGLLVQDLGARFGPQAARKSLDFVVETKGPLIAECDLSRIEQVISNFLGNAIKFTPDKGRVLLRAEEQGAQILVAVEDTGPGLPPGQLEHVFERFWQVRETAKQGTGLGLAIAKAVIDGHQGRIWAESEVGRGSKFFFSIPKAIGPRAPAPSAAQWA